MEKSLEERMTELEKKVAELESQIPDQPIEYDLKDLRNQLFQYIITTVEAAKAGRRQNSEILIDVVDRILQINMHLR